MEPALQKLAGELDGKVTIAKVNIDNSPDLSDEYGITSIPTFVLLKSGKEVDRVSTGDIGTLEGFVTDSL